MTKIKNNNSKIKVDNILKLKLIDILYCHL